MTTLCGVCLYFDETEDTCALGSALDKRGNCYEQRTGKRLTTPVDKFMSPTKKAKEK